MKKLLTNPLFIVGVGVAVYLIVTRSGSGGTDAKRQYLVDQGFKIQDTGNMSTGEVDAVYKYLVDYVQRGAKDQVPPSLKDQLKAIGDKFNIFT